MKRIDPNELTIPRVYFTEFDRITYSQVAWSPEDIEHIRLNLERKVKLFGCIKGVVIIATSHLYESELAQEFIQDYPIVLEEGIVKPALISKHQTFSDFLSYKREKSNEQEMYSGKDKDVIDNILTCCVNEVVSWDVESTSKWFGNRIRMDLQDERSVLRHSLCEVPQKVLDGVIGRLGELAQPSRGEIYLIAKDSGNRKLWANLSEYADLIYYLSGARAVNSEGVLPQENLLEFRITDLGYRKTKLSEFEIFYKILVGIIKEKTKKIFPVEILDALTFEEIIDLRRSVLHEEFIEKYNSLLELSKDRIEILDAERLVLTLKEIEELDQELHILFNNTIEKELKYLKKAEVESKGLKVLSNIGSILTFYGAVESVVQLSVNTLSLLGFDQLIMQTEDKINGCLSALDKMTDRSSLSDKPILLDYISEISKRYAGKLYGIPKYLK